MKFKLYALILLLALAVVSLGPLAVSSGGEARAEGVHFSGSRVVQSADAPQTTKKSDTSSRVFLGVILSAALITAIGVVMGLTDKAVFYEDGRDVFASFLPTVVPPVALVILMLGAGVIVGDNSPNEAAIKKGVAIVVCILEVLAIGYVFKGAYRQNGGNVAVGVVIAIAKMCLSWFCLGMLQQALGWDRNKSAAENWAGRASATVIFLITAALMKKLVNGERVRARISLQTA